VKFYWANLKLQLAHFVHNIRNSPTGRFNSVSLWSRVILVNVTAGKLDEKFKILTNRGTFTLIPIAILTSLNICRHVSMNICTVLLTVTYFVTHSLMWGMGRLKNCLLCYKQQQFVVSTVLFSSVDITKELKYNYKYGAWMCDCGNVQRGSFSLIDKYIFSQHTNVSYFSLINCRKFLFRWRISSRKHAGNKHTHTHTIYIYIYIYIYI
jgi:hypothetical protein